MLRRNNNNNHHKIRLHHQSKKNKSQKVQLRLRKFIKRKSMEKAQFRVSTEWVSQDSIFRKKLGRIQ